MVEVLYQNSPINISLPTFSANIVLDFTIRFKVPRDFRLLQKVLMTRSSHVSSAKLVSLILFSNTIHQLINSQNI